MFKFLCKLFGHNWQKIGKPIFDLGPEPQTLIWYGKQCKRCKEEQWGPKPEFNKEQ